MNVDASRSPDIDWSVVTDGYVDHALRSLLTAKRMADRWDNISEAERITHQLILRAFVETGSPPSLDDLCVLLGCPGDQVVAVLRGLSRRDLILLEGDNIPGAYPFSSLPTRHFVTMGELSIPAICAIDALGATAMVRREATMGSRCPACDDQIAIHLSSDGLAVENASPTTIMIWAGLSDVLGCAANTQCQSMLAFCGAQHLREWQAHGNSGPGFRFTPIQAVQAGAAIFRPFLSRRFL